MDRVLLLTVSHTPSAAHYPLNHHRPWVLDVLAALEVVEALETRRLSAYGGSGGGPRGLEVVLEVLGEILRPSYFLLGTQR